MYQRGLKPNEADTMLLIHRGIYVQLSVNQKAEYLAEMGIAPWFPRVRLVNAPDPLQVELEPMADFVGELYSEGQGQDETVLVPAGDVSNSQNSAQAESEGSLNSKRSITDEFVKDSGEVGNKVLPSVDQAKVSNSSIQPIKFGLAFYVIDDLIIANSLVSNYGDYQDSSWNLLQNILKALNVEKGD